MRGKQLTTLEANYEDARSIMVAQIAEDLAGCPQVPEEKRRLFADPDVPKSLTHKTGFVFSEEHYAAEFRVQLGALIIIESTILPDDSLDGAVAETGENIDGYLTQARSQQIIESLPPLFRSAFIEILRARTRETIDGTLASCEEQNQNGQTPPYNLARLEKGLEKALDGYCADMLREGEADAGA